MLLAELQNLAKTRELVSIARDCHDEEVTGFVEFVSEDLVTMQLFDNAGLYVGFAVFEFDQICEVFWGNREHRALRQLIDSREPPPAVELEADDFLSAVFELNDRFPSVCLHPADDEDHYEIANIEACDEDWCRILTFSPMKTLSRTSKLIRTESITRVVVQSAYQDSIVALHSLDI